MPRAGEDAVQAACGKKGACLEQGRMQSRQLVGYSPGSVVGPWCCAPLVHGDLKCAASLPGQCLVCTSSMLSIRVQYRLPLLSSPPHDEHCGSLLAGAGHLLDGEDGYVALSNAQHDLSVCALNAAFHQVLITSTVALFQQLSLLSWLSSRLFMCSMTRLKGATHEKAAENVARPSREKAIENVARPSRARGRTKLEKTQKFMEASVTIRVGGGDVDVALLACMQEFLEKETLAGICFVERGGTLLHLHLQMLSLLSWLSSRLFMCSMTRLKGATHEKAAENVARPSREKAIENVARPSRARGRTKLEKTQKFMEASVTIRVGGGDVDVALLACMQEFLEKETLAGICFVERDGTLLHLHLQMVIRMWSMSLVAINKMVKNYLGWAKAAPPGGIVLCHALTQRRLHTFEGMIGYCLKDDGQPQD
ncbi:hypothetical protein L7F22_036454 [Adiantum nelumboides]|nr:hypothetical protein [Adiantum nelumboides]